MTEDELLGKIDVLLGGRAAEDVVFGKISTGAANDLTKATDIARRMITDYGMSPRFRNVALTQRGASMLGPANAEPVMHREYSESTQQYIDEEIARIVNERYLRAKSLLTEKKTLLEAISQHLLEKETLEEQEFKALLSAS
jgi:cell division protease FtsH